ncbi:Sad1/UNC domain protein [Metarhizium anisopliae]
MVRAALFARGLAAAILLTFKTANAINEPHTPRGANITNSVPLSVDPRSTLEVCEARTINYITHALPQSCLTSSWRSPAPTSTASAVSQHGRDDGSDHGTDNQPSWPPTPTLDHNATEVQATEPAATTFMSFEDWKEMMLRRAGQDPQDLRSRRPSEHNTDDRYSPESGHAGLGEEGEISLNFEDYGNGDHQKLTSPRSARGDGVDEQPAPADALLYEEGKAATVHLSKDAGKTCKERFSYSSFDAGATILKTSPGAKNARAILVENKDTYMLLECDAASKYVIVELSDDISVDTVVLANFEFFSSMVRHFRVSVSDRYPVKMDKWRELGTFEARNSRDIQPFLVQNPQIWAKYVRIEFLTHFGNEYYCPISLLRIHGSRMLDSWKDSEGGRDEEALIDGDESAGADSHQDENHVADAAASRDTNVHITASNGTSARSLSYALDIFTNMDATCPAPSSAGANPPTRDPKLSSVSLGTSQESDLVSSDVSQARSASPENSGNSSIAQAKSILATGSINYSTIMPTSQDDRLRNHTGAVNGAALNVNTTTIDRENNAATPTARLSASSGQNGKPRSSGTTGASAASPTMQEGFFNAITKRLQHVESNLTLSMKYVEDQSKHIQEALQSREQRQHAKINYFLDELNKTVLAELHTVREQYDQIWQSTVLALESQRDRSERDMMALSSRLNVLADEVVFQKRMAIIQAIILLSCLFLIIFSRGVSLPSLAPLLDQPSNSPCATPTSPATPRQSSYQLSKRHHREVQSSFQPPDLSCQVQMLYPGEARSDTSAEALPFEAVSFQGTDEPRSECSAFQRLSPPPTPNLLGEMSLSSDPNSATGSNHTLRRRLGGTSHISSRKPLPSLPEHPRSSDEE